MNVNQCLRIKLVFACFATSLLLTSTSKADTSAFVPRTVGNGTQVNFEGTVGLAIAPRRDNIMITQLGIFDYGGDGLVNSHEVGFWLRNPGGDTGTLLVSGIVPSGTSAPLSDGYRWVSITPIIISWGLVYSVGAHYAAGDADAVGVVVYGQSAPDIGMLSENGRYAPGPDLTFPYIYTSSPEGQLGPRFWEANFQYQVAPEPATWLLFALGLPVLFLCRRR